MNVPVLIVASIMAIVVVAHVFGGARETARIAPNPSAANLTRHWVQAMGAFQMLSVDLLAVTLLLFGVALWDLGPAEDLILKGLIALFCLWGIVWFAQVQWLKRTGAGILQLPHWMIWFFCAGLLFVGL
ncbi:hypothetical protein [Tateyamaria sp.]|uniref:hypothetical protein n=1 Tax=Tateyamaria sp. TaxID=1929288 RepID=UPI00329EBD2E